MRRFRDVERNSRDPQFRELRYVQPSRRGMRVRDDGKLLIHLSNFRPVKRVLDCIRILAEVREACECAAADGGRWARSGPGGASGVDSWAWSRMSLSWGSRTMWSD